MSQEIFVKDVMSKSITIAKSALITEALDKMLADGLDPLIVTNNGSVIGTISRAAIAETLGSKKTSTLAPPRRFMYQTKRMNILPLSMRMKMWIYWFRFSRNIN